MLRYNLPAPSRENGERPKMGVGWRVMSVAHRFDASLNRRSPDEMTDAELMAFSAGVENRRQGATKAVGPFYEFPGSPSGGKYATD
jgi:hypothetical protein